MSRTPHSHNQRCVHMEKYCILLHYISWNCRWKKIPIPFSEVIVFAQLCSVFVFLVGVKRFWQLFLALWRPNLWLSLQKSYVVLRSKGKAAPASVLPLASGVVCSKSYSSLDKMCLKCQFLWRAKNVHRLDLLLAQHLPTFWCGCGIFF